MNSKNKFHGLYGLCSSIFLATNRPGSVNERLSKVIGFGNVLSHVDSAMICSESNNHKMIFGCATQVTLDVASFSRAVKLD